MASDGGKPLPLDDALAIVRERLKPVSDIGPLPLASALGRILGTSLKAPRALPPFDNTAVDGYAFRRADASETGPARLALAGESAAGLPFSGTVPAGAAIRISTGAVLPEGADTVAMQEDCRRDGDAVVVEPVPPVGANIRRAGADIQAGDLAAAAGTRLRAGDIALLGALGFTELPVRRKLRMAIASTGTELREGGADLKPGQIVETNGLMLAHLVAPLPVKVTMLETLPDDRALTETALKTAAATHDLIVTTGGVSVGDHDHVRPALMSAGAAHFWRLTLRPGKPVLFGEIGGAAMVGLPGNPVSAFVTFLMVVRPVIDRLMGVPVTPFAGFPVRLAAPLNKSATLREFARARLEWDGKEPRAVPYRDQSSNLLTSLSWADGLLDLPAGLSSFAVGDLVTYRPIQLLAS